MFEVNEDLSWQIRKKRALLRMSLTEASQAIQIDRTTLSKIEKTDNVQVRKTVYKKLVEWLVKESEVK